MIKPWTEEEEETVRNFYVTEGMDYLCETLGRSYDSVQKKVKKIKDSPLKPEDYQGSITFTREECGLLPKKETKLRPVDLIEELKVKLSELPKTDIKVSTYKPKEGDTLIVHFTDWHIGRIVRNEDGKEIYNIEVFKERVNKLLIEILTLLDQYIIKGTPIKDVVILSTGDIVDGMGIFASQESVSETSPPFQIMLAVEVIQNFILALLKRKLNVTMQAVRGNHGEIRGDKGKAKDPNANWDFMLYLVLDFWAKAIIKDSNITIHYSELDYLNLSIQGWKYHIRHIAPQQGETAAGKAKFLGWARKHNCDVIVSGHYHHYSIGDKLGITIIKGGSLVGSDEYTEQLAEEAEPIQLIWGCSKNRPVTFAYAIDIGERKVR
jgi:predicted phosphodiesterase